MFGLLSLLVSLFLALHVVSAPTSANDPFRAIAVHVKHQPDPPICCLKPLTPLDPAEDEVLLSFEEWKAKQSTLQAEAKAKAKEGNRSGYAQAGDAGDGSDPVSLTPDQSVSSNAMAISTTMEIPSAQPNEAVSPHFRVPLTDRFNYANLDCSARVHTSHRSAKSPSAILSSKSDRYMLSPCKSKDGNQFVVVELCEDIRIDTVQLANFEFFSGVFKDFTVSVAKTYTTDVDGYEWTHVGKYKAKNVRGVQSFHPPTSLRDFYRYIRIDFHSHYGNEFYCPVSLLRVYGLTHLEQWKWDIWESESLAKRDEPDQVDFSLTTPHLYATGSSVPTHTESSSSENNSSSDNKDIAATSENGSSESSAHFTEWKRRLDNIDTSTDRHDREDSYQTSSYPRVTKAGTLTIEPELPNSRTKFDDTTQEPSRSPSGSYSSATGVLAKASCTSCRNAVDSISSESTADSFSQAASSPRSSNPSSSTPSIISGTSISASPHTTPSAIPLASPSLPPTVSGGESIYRTIMNRLTALEANHTLYIRYVEQQTSGVREVLRRLGEDIGRLEGISRAQAVTYQRTIQDWERQRNQLRMEYGMLLSRVDYLSEEIILEKRLGIAQLCLLLAVLVFMGLTRGSRNESFMEHAPVKFNKSMREWGKSFSGEWTKFSRKARSRSPRTRPNMTSEKPLTVDTTPFDTAKKVQVNIPTQDTWNYEALERNKPNSVESLSGTQIRSRSRTPSLRTPVSRHRRPMTPTAAFRPQLQRSNSQGGGPTPMGAISKSTRKWARTAHLHEMRDTFWTGGRPRRGDDIAHHSKRTVVDENIDVFTSPHLAQNGDTVSRRNADTANRVSISSRPFIIGKTPDAEDNWIDTDCSVEGSEMD